MSKIQMNDMNFYLSKLAETALNTPYALTADFVGGKCNAFQPPLPFVQKTVDGMVGDGSERAQKLRRGWLRPLRLPINGQLNCETAGRIFTRLLGGTRTVSAELTALSGAYDITVLTQTKAQGRTPKLTTIGFDLGGYNFIHSSMAVANGEISFEGEGDVGFTSEHVNTGLYHRNLLAAAIQALGYSASYAAAVAVGAALIVPPAPPSHHLMHPAATKVTFSDGTSRDFASDGSLISGACGMNNAIVVKGEPGDPFIDATDRKSGAYARDLHRGTRMPMARLKVSQDAMDAAFLAAQNGTDITSLTYLFRSDEKILTSAYWYEFEMKCPLAELEVIDADPDGDDTGYTLNFYPKTDPVTGGYWILRLRTDDQTLQ